MNLSYTLLLLVLAGICWLGSRYFENRQKKLTDAHCIRVKAKVQDYAPLESADRKGRPVFSTILEYEVEGKEYQVQLDDQVPEAFKQPVGSIVELLCSKTDPSQCMLAELPVKKGLFGW